LRKGEETVIQIRCSVETKRRFKMFVVGSGKKNYESALVHLLDYYEGKFSRLPITTRGPKASRF
jgi:hypothetical protein